MAPEYFFWTQKGTEQDYNIAVSFSAPSHAGANDGTARRKPALFLLPLRRSLSQRWPMLALNLKNIIARTNNRHFQALTASLSTRGLHGMSESGQPGPVQLSIQKKVRMIYSGLDISRTAIILKPLAMTHSSPIFSVQLSSVLRMTLRNTDITQL